MSGVTKSGFVGKTYSDILYDLEVKARELWGDDVDLSVYSPLGMLLQNVANSQAELWEALEAIYYNSYLDTAEGVALERLTKLVGINRKPPQKEVVLLQFTGTNYTVIPVGFKVKTPTGIQYQTISTDGIISGGVANIQAEAMETGTESRASIGQLTEIVNPMAGVDTVTNLAESSGGSALETDQDLRARVISNQNALLNFGVANYIKTQLLNNDTIISVGVTENKTNVLVGTMPAHSIKFVIEGGVDQEIGELIWQYKPAGIETVGDVEINVNNGYGGSDIIKFSRPTNVSIYCSVDITTEAGFDMDNIRAMTADIVEYIGGTDSYVSEGVPVSDVYPGSGIGQKVIAWKLYSILGEYQKLESLTILFGTSAGDVNYSVINMDSDKQANIVTANITMNVS